ncbi:MAG: DNA repair protein RecO [Candidatus Algichlamydia australiensis]|nr:DNA repair protein RecO [Chlamydiales bacterium]
MEELSTEAIVLRTTAYGERKNILTLFSKEGGLLSTSSYISLKKRGYLSALCRCNFLLTRKTSELYTLKDVTPLDLYTEIRSNYDKLNCAGYWLKTLLRSQLPSKPSPLLYQLLICYLEELKTTSEVSQIKMSFLLKVLKHEGLYMPSRFFTEAQKLADVRKFLELDEIVITHDMEKEIETRFWGAISHE